MGRCFRCKTDFSSGTLYHGHEYCTTCYLRVKQDDEAKKKREEEARRRALEARREAILGAVRHHADAKVAPPQGSGRAVVSPPAKPKRGIHLHPHHLPSKPIAPSAHHSPAHGINFALPPASGASHERHSPMKRAVKVHSSSPHGLFIGSHGSSSKLSISSVSKLPEHLSQGQQGISIEVKGLNLGSKPSSVRLEAWAKDSSGKKFKAESEPKHLTLDAVGEGIFTLTFNVPPDAAKGKLILFARLHENAYHIDPAQGRSETLEISSEIK